MMPLARISSLPSENRTKLLDAAEALMLSKGFVATSVEEICNAAEVTKGSFFHYFTTKQDLGKILLERFTERQMQSFQGALAQIDDPLQRIFTVIEFASAGAGDPESKGCLVGTFAQEISDTHPALQAVCQASFEGIASQMGADFQAAKELHCPNAEFDALSLGNHFIAVVQGSLLLRKATGDCVGMQSNLGHLRSYLETLYAR